MVKLGIIAFCSMAAEGTMFDWSGVYFREIVKAPPSLVILGYATFMVMMATGRFAGDRIIGRIGRKKTLQLSGIFVFTGLLISVMFPYLVTATTGFFIVGLGVSSVIPTVYSTAARLAKTSPGMALAGVSSIGFLGFLIFWSGGALRPLCKRYGFEIESDGLVCSNETFFYDHICYCNQQACYSSRIAEVVN